MKRNLFAVLALLFSVVVAAQPATPQAYATSVFNALKAKDSAAFVANYPTLAQFKSFVRYVAEAQLKKPEVVAAMKADPAAASLNIDSLLNAQLAMFDNPAVFGEIEKKYMENYKQVIESGEKKGVRWADAVMTGQTVDSAAADNEMAEAGVTAMNGVIDFRSAGQDYQLRFNEVIYIPNEKAWFGGDFKDVMRKGEKEMVDEEVSLDSIQKIKVEPIPKAVTETKTKTKSKTPVTKTKTKTVGRKPVIKG